jgi:Mn-dependent DtxR family transcriptional regulator
MTVALAGWALFFLGLALLLLLRGGLLPRWRRARRLSSRVLVEDALKHVQETEYRGGKATLPSLAGALSVPMNEAAELAGRMEAHGLLRSAGEGLATTPAGRDYALQVIRAHRLWERYLADETGVTAAKWHDKAERREHTLSREEADRLAARLGTTWWRWPATPTPARARSSTRSPATAPAHRQLARQDRHPRRGRLRVRRQRYKLVDLPGTYSLLATSLDEEVARDFILFGQPDVTIVVVVGRHPAGAQPEPGLAGAGDHRPGGGLPEPDGRGAAARAGGRRAPAGPRPGRAGGAHRGPASARGWPSCCRPSTTWPAASTVTQAAPHQERAACAEAGRRPLGDAVGAGFSPACPTPAGWRCACWTATNAIGAAIRRRRAGRLSRTKGRPARRRGRPMVAEGATTWRDEGRRPQTTDANDLWDIRGVRAAALAGRRLPSSAHRRASTPTRRGSPTARSRASGPGASTWTASWTGC